MDKRIFCWKKADFQVKSESLVRELLHNLGLPAWKVFVLCKYMMYLILLRTCLHLQRSTFSRAGTDHVLDEVSVQADLANYAFFAIESPLPGQFDQRLGSWQEVLCFCWGSSRTWQITQPNSFTWWIKYWCGLCCQNHCSIQLISFQGYHNRIIQAEFQVRQTIPKLTLCYI